MLRIVFLAILAFALPAPAGELHLRSADRIAQGHDKVCWFASAEMCARYQGLTGVYGITERVRRSPVAMVGAYPADQDLWVSRTGVSLWFSPYGKTQKGADWLHARIAWGRPVVVGVNGGAHAVVCTRADAG